VINIEGNARHLLPKCERSNNEQKATLAQRA
jgi:hypothetical protein